MNELRNPRLPQHHSVSLEDTYREVSKPIHLTALSPSYAIHHRLMLKPVLVLIRIALQESPAPRIP